jgi:succinate dehydrogenase/fumarate reductase flavoprotein subunit
MQLQDPFFSPTPPQSCDLLIIGSGAAGLAAAFTAAHRGAHVVLADKADVFGGTTAWSGGWMWVPRNPLAQAAGIRESLEAPLQYLQEDLGAKYDAARLTRYLESAPDMVAYFLQHSALAFIDGNAVPDFHGEHAHAAVGGRSVCAAPFDARALGPMQTYVKPPLTETTVWGMGLAAGADMRLFINRFSQWAGFKHVAKRLLRLAGDRLLHGQNQRWVNGHALVGALLLSAVRAGAQLLNNTQALRLRQDAQGRVVGAYLRNPVWGKEPVYVEANLGVVLACGGFPFDTARIKTCLDHAPNGVEHKSAGNPGNTGDGLNMAEAVGAKIRQDLDQAAALCPVSVVPRANGAPAHFAHLVERAKPGLIAVAADGKRFTNEADPYHDFMKDLLGHTKGSEAHAWLIVDQVFLRRYGLGAVKPFPFLIKPWLKNGYLKSGPTLTLVAQACGIDAARLNATVQDYNAQALLGIDREFNKGVSAYNRAQGDAWWANKHRWPNPCMAPVQQAPFYAVRVVPGSLGTFAGLDTNEHAQVIGPNGACIEGLYACGNDMSSLFGGHYPSGGITLGPAMTYGWLAALHATISLQSSN